MRQCPAKGNREWVSTHEKRQPALANTALYVPLCAVRGGFAMGVFPRLAAKHVRGRGREVSLPQKPYWCGGLHVASPKSETSRAVLPVGRRSGSNQVPYC